MIRRTAGGDGPSPPAACQSVDSGAGFVVAAAARFVPSAERSDGSGLLYDAVTGSVARLGAAEWLVLQQFDGRPLEEVRERLRRECGFEFGPGELEAFAQTSHEAGILHDDRGPAVRRSRVAGLSWHIALWNPERQFTWLAAHTGLLCCHAVIAAATLMVATAVYSATVRPANGARGHMWINIAVFSVLVNVVGLLHECGHGVTLHRYGRRVREIGLRFILGWPSWYCDLTESYLLPTRRARVGVLLAGPFVQAVVCAALVLAATGGSPLARALHGSAAVVGALTVVNFIPMLPTDGYFLLTEITGIFNLRAKGRRWLMSSRERRRVRRDRPPAERTIIAMYGICSALFVGVVILRTAVVCGRALFGTAPFSTRAFMAGLSLAVMGLAFWKGKSGRGPIQRTQRS